MSYHVEIAESAERDLAEITDAVAFAYGDAIGAARLARRILDEIESLEDMPARYQLSPNPMLSALGCRQFAVGNFNIVYLIDECANAVKVVAIAYYRRLIDFAATRI